MRLSEILLESDLNYIEWQNNFEKKQLDQHYMGYQAVLHIGEFKFEMDFLEFESNVYFRGWDIHSDSKEALSGKTSTGLFSKIIELVKEATIEFLSKKRPLIMAMCGGDPKRSSYIASNYGNWTPRGYKFMKIRSAELNEATTSDGIMGGVYMQWNSKELELKAKKMIAQMYWPEYSKTAMRENPKFLEFFK